MSGLAFDICLVYLDDIIVYADSVAQMLERLRSVLQRLRDARLKIKPSKCAVLQKVVEFLGHLISEDGISASPSKISAVLEWPPPCSVKEVRAYVGLCSYYRRFVQNFAAMATPLHALTGKNCQAFVWTEASQNSFEALQKALTSPTILAMPTDSPNDEFCLNTVASDFAIAAVL